MPPLKLNILIATKTHNDDAINDIFEQAGTLLAKKVLALLPKASIVS